MVWGHVIGKLAAAAAIPRRGSSVEERKGNVRLGERGGVFQFRLLTFLYYSWQTKYCPRMLCVLSSWNFLEQKEWEVNLFLKQLTTNLENLVIFFINSYLENLKIHLLCTLVPVDKLLLKIVPKIF